MMWYRFSHVTNIHHRFTITVRTLDIQGARNTSLVVGQLSLGLIKYGKMADATTLRMYVIQSRGSRQLRIRNRMWTCPGDWNLYDCISQASNR